MTSAMLWRTFILAGSAAQFVLPHVSGEQHKHAASVDRARGVGFMAVLPSLGILSDPTFFG